MTVQFLLDSNILSEPSRPSPNEAVLSKLEQHQFEIGVASIVVHELLYGCWRLAPSNRQDVLWQYIQESVLSLPVFDYDREAARWRARERRLRSLAKVSNAKMNVPAAKWMGYHFAPLTHFVNQPRLSNQASVPVPSR